MGTISPNCCNTAAITPPPVHWNALKPNNIPIDPHALRGKQQKHIGMSWCALLPKKRE